jgi:integrase
MEALRQHDYFPSIPPAEQYPILHDQENTKAYDSTAPLPFRIFLATFKETKSQIFSYKDRSVWFRFILKELAASTLPDQPLIEQYLQHLYRHLCTARTVYHTYKTIRDFLHYLQCTSQHSLCTITRSDLEAYLEHEQDRGLKLSSVRLKLVTLRAVIRFLIEQESLPPELLIRPLRIKLPEALPKALDPADTRQLLRVIHQLRDRALVLLLLRTCLLPNHLMCNSRSKRFSFTRPRRTAPVALCTSAKMHGVL